MNQQSSRDVSDTERDVRAYIADAKKYGFLGGVPVREVEALLQVIDSLRSAGETIGDLPVNWDLIREAREVTRIDGPAASTDLTQRLLNELTRWIRRSRRSAESSGELVERAVFDAELKALGERMAADGKIVIKQLLFEAEVNGRRKCLFDNWPEHLKHEAYDRLGLDPVEMFRRRASKAAASRPAPDSAGEKP